MVKADAGVCDGCPIHESGRSKKKCPTQCPKLRQFRKAVNQGAKLTNGHAGAVVYSSKQGRVSPGPMAL